MLSIYFEGDFANFADPRLKAEGGTFFVPTGSAMRGAAEAIRYKPEVYLDPRRIIVHKKPKTVSCKIQGVDKKIGPRGLERPINFAKIQLMNMLFLCDVAYTVEYDLRLCRRKDGEVAEFDCEPTPQAHLAKYYEMYEDWVRKGKCWRQPYLGSKMCLARFRPPRDTDKPIAMTQDFGHMVHGIEYRRTGNIAHVFRAVMQDGVIDIPSFFDVLKFKAEAA